MVYGKISDMNVSSARFYAGRTGAERADLRRSSFVAAAIALIAEDGWRGLTAERVSVRAGISKRYFYENFTDVDALAAAVIEHLATGLTTHIDAAENTEHPVSQRSHDIIGAMTEYLTDVPARARVLFAEMSSTAPAVAFRKDAMHRIEQLIIDAARNIHGKRVASEPIAGLTAIMLLAGTGQAILDWLDGDIDITRQELIDDLSTMWVILGDGVAAQSLRAGGTGTVKR